MIEIEQLTKQFGDLRAVDDISLTVPAGEFFVILGPNAAGKTTTIAILLGLLLPSSGRVEVLGENMLRRRHRVLPRLNFSSPYVDLPHRLTVRQNLRVYAHLYGLNAIDRRLGEMAEMFDLGAFIDRPFGPLSAGQRTRVALAKALINEPELLLLDEPITGLDLASQERILEVLGQETAAGRTVVVTTHNLDEARHCDRVLVLDRRLVAMGTPDEVLRPSVLREAYGDRLLGDHADHEHAHDLIVVDDHGHGSHG